MAKSKTRASKRTTSSGAKRSKSVKSVGTSKSQQRGPMGGTSKPPSERGSRSTYFSTAPAAIGAIMVGRGPSVTYIPNGARVTGEDYVTTLSPVNSVNTTWATVAGFPLNPYGLGSNTLCDMARIYKEYRYTRLAICYVPSVGTGSAGQIAVYRKKDRLDPLLDPNGANFFPFVLNQRTGVIAPVWQAVSFETTTSDNWRSTIPIETDPNDECDGEVFVATNNTSTSPIISIGLVKIMYVCEFRELGRNSRTALIPLALQIYSNISVGGNGLSVTPASLFSVSTFANDQTGNPSVTPSAIQIGDIFKFVVDTNRSSFGASNLSNLLAVSIGGGNRAITLANGYTIYLVYVGANVWEGFLTYPMASSLGNPLLFNLTSASLTFNLVGMISLIGTDLFRTNVDI